jgi:hypothetical protein
MKYYVLVWYDFYVGICDIPSKYDDDKALMLEQ